MAESQKYNNKWMQVDACGCYLLYGCYLLAHGCRLLPQCARYQRRHAGVLLSRYAGSATRKLTSSNILLSFVIGSRHILANNNLVGCGNRRIGLRQGHQELMERITSSPRSERGIRPCPPCHDVRTES